MAKVESKRIIKLKPTSIAMFQGAFAAILGLGVAIIYSVRATIGIAGETDSVITGMAFGLATGVLSIVVLPLIYFAFGWVIGLVQGWFYNIVLGASGGVVVDVEDEK